MSGRCGAHALDILVIVMKNQEKRAGSLKICDERLDAAFERFLVDFLARTKRKVLLTRSRGMDAKKRSEADLSMVWNECV